MGSNGCNVFILLPNLVADGLDRSLANRFLGTIKTVCAFSEPVMMQPFFIGFMQMSRLLHIPLPAPDHAPSHPTCIAPVDPPVPFYLQLLPPSLLLHPPSSPSSSSFFLEAVGVDLFHHHFQEFSLSQTG